MYEVTVPEDAQDGDTFEFSGTAEDADGTVSVSGDSTITVQADDGDGNGDGDNGDTGPDADRIFDSIEDLEGSLVYSGQVVAVQDDELEADEEIQIRRVTGDDQSTPELLETVNDNGYLVFDTSELQNANYVLRGGGLDDEGEFQIVEQNIDASLDDGEVLNSGSTTEELSIASAIRNDYDVDVTVPELAGADDPEAALAGILGIDASDVSLNDDDEPVATLEDAEGTHTLDFADVDAGDYTIELAVTDTTASASLDITVSEPADTAISFEEAQPADERGDIAQIVLNLDNTDTGYVVIGQEEESGYSLELEVTDAGSGDSDDGQVTIMFNTYEAGDRTDAPTAWAAQGGDSVTVEDETSTGGVLSTGSYVLLASTTSVEEAVNDPGANGAFTLEPRPGEFSVNTYTGPAGAEDSYGDDDEGLTSATLVASAIEDGTLTEASDVTKTTYGDEAFDALVYEFEASGISGVLYDDGIGADEFADVMSADEQDPGQNQAAKVLDLAESPAGVSVHADLDTDTYYVVLDADAAELVRGDSDASIETGETYTTTFALDDDITADDTEISTSTDVSFVAGSLSLDYRGGSYGVVPSEEATITGTTNFAPGTELDIRVRALSAESTFRHTADATVQSDGSFSASFDLSGEPQGIEFDIELLSPSGTVFDTIPGELTAPPSASVTFDDQESPGGAVVTVQSVTLSEGGFVAIHVGSAGGQIIGSSALLSSGTTQNVKIALDQALGSDGTLVAMPHFDSNGDGMFNGSDDAPYMADGSPVTDDAAITFADSGGPDTVTVTRTVTVVQPSPTPREVEVTRTVTVVQPSPTPREVERTVTVTVEVTQTDGQPGFGIAVAIAALLAAALLAVRRRD